MNWNFDKLEKYRVEAGNYGTKYGEKFGAFYIPFESYILKVLATDGKGFDPQWEHVSVSLPGRCPNWREMCFIKDLFWSKEETVLQIHPPESLYINQHPHCLHLWKNPNNIFELPPLEYVGVVSTSPPTV